MFKRNKDIGDLDFQTLRGQLDQSAQVRLDDRLRKLVLKGDERPKLNALVGGNPAPYCFTDLLPFLDQGAGSSRLVRFLLLVLLLVAAAVAGFFLLPEIDFTTKIFLVFVECGLVVLGFFGFSRWMALIYVVPLAFSANFLAFEKPKYLLLAELEALVGNLARSEQKLAKALSEFQRSWKRCDPDDPTRCRIFKVGSEPLKEKVLQMQAIRDRDKKRLSSFEERFFDGAWQVSVPEPDWFSVILNVLLRGTVMLIIFLLSHRLSEKRRGIRPMAEGEPWVPTSTA